MQKRIRSTVSIDAQGDGQFSLKIPGTFSGLVKAEGATGRVVLSGEVQLVAQTLGDHIIDFYINDTDGVVPVEIQAAFPDYPIIGSWIDKQIHSENQGINLMTGINKIVPPPGEGFVPSGLYLVATIKKGIAGLDTAYVNIIWDDLA